MCIFIATIVPTATPEAELCAVMGEFSMGCRPCDDPALTDHLSGERAFYTTQGHCSCGTLLGQQFRVTRQSVDVRQITLDAAKKRKAGWSAAQVERWRQEREAAVQKRDAEAEAREQHFGEIARFADFVRAMTSRGVASQVGFYYREHGGNDEYAPLTRRRVRVSEMSAEDFLQMPENVLTIFAA